MRKLPLVLMLAAFSVSAKELRSSCVQGEAYAKQVRQARLDNAYFFQSALRKRKLRLLPWKDVRSQERAFEIEAVKLEENASNPPLAIKEWEARSYQRVEKDGKTYIAGKPFEARIAISPSLERRDAELREAFPPRLELFAYDKSDRIHPLVLDAQTKERPVRFCAACVNFCDSIENVSWLSQNQYAPCVMAGGAAVRMAPPSDRYLIQRLYPIGTSTQVGEPITLHYTDLIFKNTNHDPQPPCPAPP